MLKTTQDLVGIMERSDLVLVDCRSYKEYASGHIPGAVNLDFFSYHWVDTTEEGLGAFERQMEMLFRFIGVEEQKIVIFYDDVAGMSAARGAWLLKCFSHKNTFILDGGLRKWQASGLPIETKTNSFTPSNFSGKLDTSKLVGFEYLKERLGKAALIDARTKEEFDGKIVRAARKGRIPGSQNIDWVLNINPDGTMKSRDELEKLYHFPKGDEIIAYCQGGYRAANTFVALKLLGYENVKVYLGSWAEWANRLDLPVED